MNTGQVSAHELATVLHAVGLSYEKVGMRLGKERKYGTLALLGPTTSTYPLQHVSFFGDEPPEGTRSYELAPEKNKRLSENPTDFSSFQSRDPDNMRWGGAIRVPERNWIRYMAWSSFPELVDEAYMLAIAATTGLMSEAQAADIAKISKNPHLDAIHRVMFS